MTENFFNAREYRLDNGIDIVTIKRETAITSISVGIKVGALHEKEDEKGLSHFIEHMLFKGTKKRDNNALSQDLEDRAGSYNAFTDYISTVFSITALSEELEVSMEILSDMIINSTFPKSEIEKERGVILAEARNSIDDVEEYSFMKVNEAAFEKGPLKDDIIGREELISSFTREQLLGYYKKYYIPNNAVISIVSPYEHEDTKELIVKYFSGWKPSKVEKINIISEDNIPGEKITLKDNIEQSTLLYLYTFHGLNKREEMALDILSHKLGESPNSILFRALREDRGLAYDVYTHIDITDHIKTLYIYTAIGEENLYEAKEIIEDSIKKVINKEIIIDDKNINLMKKVIKTGIASILEDSQGLCSYVLNQKIMNKRIDQFTLDLKELNNVYSEDIYNVAKKVLDRPTIHILTGKEDF